MHCRIAPTESKNPTRPSLRFSWFEAARFSCLRLQNLQNSFFSNVILLLDILVVAIFLQGEYGEFLRQGRIADKSTRKKSEASAPPARTAQGKQLLPPVMKSEMIMLMLFTEKSSCTLIIRRCCCDFGITHTKMHQFPLISNLGLPALPAFRNTDVNRTRPWSFSSILRAF
jgi:hypothetical protein